MEKEQVFRDEKGRKYKHIGRKIGLVAALMQAVSGLLAGIICVFMFDSLVTKLQEERCTNGTNMLEQEISRLSDGGDVNEMLDSLKSRMGCEFTIFEGDTRVYSTVMKDGERVVGTKLSDDLQEIVLNEGRSYVGEAPILGKNYLCSYVPVKEESGEVTGLIFAGISKEDADKEIQRVIGMAAAASIAVIVVCVLIMSAYLKKRISVPLDAITRVAVCLEQGDLGLSSGKEMQTGVCSNDEIGMLGQIFENTIRRLRAYIGEIGSVLGSIAEGNLTQNTRQDYMGDFQSIKTSLDSIQNELNKTMGQIAESADQVSDGSSQVSGSAQALAQGATEQAAAVQQISATIAGISENAKQTSEAAADVGGVVEKAGAQLGISMEYVKDLNTAMENISSSSKEINSIIAAIENIAFQINILALNAAVEAARAGTAGKGFAVVADEVGNLAAKSNESAKATKELIKSSITAITEGSDVVNKVTESLELTNQLAGSVTEKMGIVVDAVEKQTAAIVQVNTGVEQISAVVQTNSATSEECAAASQELSSQADLLENLMKSFRLK